MNCANPQCDNPILNVQPSLLKLCRWECHTCSARPMRKDGGPAVRWHNFKITHAGPKLVIDYQKEFTRR